MVTHDSLSWLLIDSIKSAKRKIILEDDYWLLRTPFAISSCVRQMVMGQKLRIGDYLKKSSQWKLFKTRTQKIATSPISLWGERWVKNNNHHHLTIIIFYHEWRRGESPNSKPVNLPSVEPSSYGIRQVWQSSPLVTTEGHSSLARMHSPFYYSRRHSSKLHLWYVP